MNRTTESAKNEKTQPTTTSLSVGSHISRVGAEEISPNVRIGEFSLTRVKRMSTSRDFQPTYNGSEHPCAMVETLSEVSEKNFENMAGLSPRVADFYYYKKGLKTRTHRVSAQGLGLSPEGRDART